VDQQTLSIALWGLAVLTLIGLVFGFALAAAAMRFRVATNPVVDEVRDNLPSANCGACGFAGCTAYAEAVVEEKEVSPSLCTPGRAPVAEIVARLTGKEMGSVEDRLVVMRCHGTSAYARNEAEYYGVETCAAASLVFGGPKACKNGCLGLGDCVRACPFDALYLGEDGIAVVDNEKCTGCGVCVPICPKSLLELYPRSRRIELSCVAREKQKAVRATCMVGCTICRRCVKECPADAISWDGTTIKIDHDVCEAYGPSCNEVCVDICPSTILHRVGQKPEPEKKKDAQPVEV
jgi:electron transport complex protein RnfB